MIFTLRVSTFSLFVANYREYSSKKEEIAAAAAPLFSSCVCFDSCSFHPEPQQAWMKLTKFYLQEMKRKDSKGTPTSQEKKGE